MRRFSNNIVEQADSIDGRNFLIRPRINALLANSIKCNPLVVICAGAGYGKTRAVYDFLQGQENLVIWTQCSKHDNVSSHFWENHIKIISQSKKSDKFKQ